MTATATDVGPAALRRGYGGLERIEIGEVPVPAPGPADVLIRVEAAALNPADVFLLQGTPWVLRLAAGVRRPRQPVIGSDCAGTVVAVGARVTDLRPGDRVFGEVRGSLAQHTLASASRVAVLPPEVPAIHGAAVVMAGLAALHALDAARVEAGRTVLINGAAGGIGHLAVQLAAARGARVTAVCSAANAGWVGALGAERVVDYARESLLDLDERFDVVLDNVGNHAMRDVLARVDTGGVLLPNSGFPGPDGGALRRVLKARLLNLVARQRVITFYSAPNRGDLEALAGMLGQGTLRPTVDSVVPLARAAEAVERVMSRHAAGKVVVVP